MKAVQINAYGGNEVLEVNNSAAVPVPAAGQVLVEAYAASINPVDLGIRAGYLQKMVPLTFPVTLGGDFAGVVTGLGEGGGDYKIGDEVYGQAILLNGGSGTFADFVSANTKNIARKPQTVNFTAAASLPLVGVSALQALTEHMKLTSGQKVLIHGGAGGIGSLAIQLAKSAGAFVATTVSSQDKEFARALGADQMFDYKTENFAEVLKNFDAVFDTVGGDTTRQSFSVLRPGGVLVSMRGQPDIKLAAKYKVTAIGQATATNTEHLERLAKLVDSGKIQAQVDKVFPLTEIKAAYIYFETGHPRGKVVVKIK